MHVKLGPHGRDTGGILGLQRNTISVIGILASGSNSTALR